MTDRTPLKVLFVTGALSFGGLERIVINLCRHLDPERFKAVVVCLKSRGELAVELEEAGVHVISLEANLKRVFKYINWIRLAQVIRSQRPAVIHTHNTAALLDTALAYAIAPGFAWVHTDHNRAFPDRMRYMVAERLASLLIYRMVAVSQENRDNLIHYEKINRHKLTVISNGIDKAQFNLSIDVDRLKMQLDLAKFDFLIGTVSVLREEKGLRFLIAASTAVLQKYPQTGFIIVGGGPLREQLENRCKELDVHPNFRFLGSRKDIPDLLKLFDIYVLPSLWEGLPVSLLEAMASRKCILASEVGGIPLAVRNGKDGVLIPPQNESLLADNLLTLRENASLRSQYAQSAYQRFEENFTVGGMVNKYQQIYMEAIDQKLSRP